MKYLVSALFALALTACATNPLDNVGARAAVFKLESAYGIAQQAALAYDHLPRCTVAPRPCSTFTTVKKLAALDKVARAKLSYAEDLVRNHPSLNPADAIAAASQAIDLFHIAEAF